MASAPRFKFFDSQGEYIASLKYADDAAILLAVHGPGSSVRLGHSKKDTLLEVTEENHASIVNSYDETAELILKGGAE